MDNNITPVILTAKELELHYGAQVILEKASFYPEVGDIIKWDNEFYEIDNVDANQYFAGKNPDTWANGSKFGYSVSVLCDSHVTRQTPTNIRKMRFGTTGDHQSYKGF